MPFLLKTDRSNASGHGLSYRLAGTTCLALLLACSMAATGCEEKKPDNSPKPPPITSGNDGQTMVPVDDADAAPVKKRGTIYTPTWAEINVPQPIDDVKWDDRGRMLVNGKKFFPIVLYDGDFSSDILAMYRDFAFNTLMSNRMADVDRLRENGFYVGAYQSAAAKFKDLSTVLFVVGIDTPGHELKEPGKGMEAEVKRIRETVPGRPIFHAMAYWRKDKEAVQTKDVYPRELYEDLFKLNDISAPFLYPVPHFKLSELPPAYDRIHDATGGKKPLIPIQQIFGWRNSDRFPTPEELRTMVLLSLAKGADGICYYSYNRARNGKAVNIEEQAPQLWLSVKDTNAIAKRVGEFYLESTPTDLISVESPNKNVIWRAETFNDQAVLVVVNLAEEDAMVTINIKGDAWPSFCKLETGEPMSISSGQIVMNMGPLQSMVLTSDRTMVVPTPGR